MILVKAGEVDLYLEGGTSLALPRNLGMIHDESGEQLDRCSLFFGPFDDEGAFDEELPQVAAYYFGSDYVARRAGFDVPDSGWEMWGVSRGSSTSGRVNLRMIGRTTSSAPSSSSPPARGGASISPTIAKSTGGGSFIRE